MLTFIALGANLGEDPARSITEAVERLSAENQVEPRRMAPLYRSKPVGPQDQPDYVNTVLEAETALSPQALLDHLKGIEAAMGRDPGGRRWGARVIDLDILLYGEAQIDEPRLVIPHREMSRRRFVLAPLADLVPSLVVPGDGRTVRECLADLTDDPSSVELLGDAPP